jgi:hypothetical protein
MWINGGRCDLTEKKEFARSVSRPSMLQHILGTMLLCVGIFRLFLRRRRQCTVGKSQYILDDDKGQLISKCLFGIFNSPKKRTKKIRLYYYGTSSRIVSVRFMGELKTTKDISKLIDL